MFRYPFHSIVYYTEYNVGLAYDQVVGPSHKYLWVLLVLLGPPVSLLFLIGFVRGIKVEPMIFFGVLVFFIWHSSFPYKVERFIFPIVPLVVILGYLGWNQLVQNSAFLSKRPTWLFYSWSYFWVLNTVFLVALTFSSVHLGRIKSMSFFKDKDAIKSIIVYHPRTFWRYNPVYYSGKPIARWELFKTDQDYLWHNAIETKEYLDDDFIMLFAINSSDSIASLKKTLARLQKNPNYVLIKGLEKRQERVDLWEKEYAPMEFIEEIRPSNFDRLMNFLNPKYNPDDHYFIYRADVE